jgi:hypothetical protein
MKITSLLKKVILEQSRFEILYDNLVKPTTNKEGQKVKPKLSKEEFYKLLQADPTTRLNNIDLDSATKEDIGRVKVGKYVAWIIKNYLTPKTERNPGDSGYEREASRYKEVFMEDLYKITEDLTKFDRFKSKIKGEKDINKMSPDQLYDAVKDFDLMLAKTTKSERKSAPVHPGGKLLHDGENWRVIEIEDKGSIGKEAACFYGGNQKETRWCTSAPGLSYFERYIKDGPLYVVYNPNDTKVTPETGLPVERYQFHFPSNQFMDKDDRQIDLVKYLNGPMSELKEIFKPEFAKGLTVNGKSVNIDSFSHGAIGKFVALYGLDDLFKSLPESIESLQIQNRDNNGIIIDIPEEIGRFKNLTMIMFENCVERVPDSICKLNNLNFFALVGNDKLVEIPECVGNMKSLVFLNLIRSNNVRVPESVKARATDMGNGMWDFSEDED